MAFVNKSGKGLGGKPPRRSGRMLRKSREPLRSDQSPVLLAAVGISLFVVGIALGFGYQADQAVRGGVIRQRAEAMQRPDWVYIQNLPDYVHDAFVAVAQPSLLTRGTFRPEQDGRTVARSLVHQVHLLPPSLAGEAREMVMGPLLERRMPARSLMELYLNRVYLGRSQGIPVYGLYYAAQEYFGKSPSELTLGEAATLAGLLLRPQIEEPRVQVGAVGARRNEILLGLLRGQLITPAEFEAALAEPLGLHPGLEQMPYSRPADWGEQPEVIRLPPGLRPVPVDSTQVEEEG